MTYDPRPWFYALTLLAGALAVAIGGLQHPMLVGEGPAQLVTIGETRAWRALHWTLAGGYVAVVAGLAGLAARHTGTPGARPALMGVLVSGLGYGVSLVGILFMLGGAAALAETYLRAEPGLAGTHAVFLYDMLHPFVQTTIRLGAAAISFGLYAFGWAVLTGGTLPRWLGIAGAAGGAAGVALAVTAAPDTAFLVAGVGLATLWQAAAAVVVLVSARSGATA